jgi:RHS repeat-associated protein
MSPRSLIAFAFFVGSILPAAIAAQDVTPNGNSLTATPNSSDNWASFSVYNMMGSSQTIALSCSGTGAITDCSVQSSIVLGPDEYGSVYVSFTTGGAGSGNLVLMAEGTGGSDDGWYVVTVQAPPDPQRQPPVVSLAPHNADNQKSGFCVANCFDAVVAHSTPAYVSLDAPRAITLAYRSSQAKATGVIQLDVRDTSAIKADKISLKLKRPDGSFVTFTNGTTELFFQANSPDWMRLAAQFDAGALGTSAYNYTAVVTSHWSGVTRETTTPVRIIIVNEKDSPFGWGWSLIGLQRLTFVADSILITEGDGSAMFFRRTSCTGAACTYTHPPGDFSTLTSRATVGSDQIKYDRKYPDGITAGFNTSGRLLRVSDRYGNAMTYAYNASGRLTTITDPIGKLTRFLYGADTKLDSIVDPAARRTTVTIDGAFNVVSIKDPAGGFPFQSPTYDGSHRLISYTDRRGGTWKIGYDFAGKLATDSMPAITIDGQSIRPVVQYRSYTAAALIDPATGQGTAGNPAPRRKADTLRADVTNPRGFSTRYALNRWGAATRIEEPLGRVSTITWNDSAQVTRSTAPVGRIAKLTWNKSNLTKMWDSTTGQVQNFQYEPTFNQVTQTSGHARPTWNYYGTNGRLDSTRVGSSSAKVTKLTYDSRGRALSVTDPEGHITRTYYAPAAWQNTDSVVAPGTRRTAFTYDAYGLVVTVRNPLNQVRSSAHDVLNRVVRKIGPLADTTIYSYDSLFLRSVRDAIGQTYTYTRNALGWQVVATDPAGRSDSASYDRNGNVARTVSRAGRTVIHTYDELDRPRLISAGVDTTEFIADPLDRFTVAITDASVDTLTFDAAGRPQDAITWRAGQRSVLTSQFDTAGNRTRLDYSPSSGFANHGYISYAYDASQQLHILAGTTTSGFGTIMTFNADRQATRAWMPNGMDIFRRYPSSHRAAEISYEDAGVNAALGVSYTQDTLGRVIERRRPVFPDTLRQYGYDAAGRLRSYGDYATTQSEPQCSWQPDLGFTCSPPPGLYLVRSALYTYDKVGNRTDQGAAVMTGNRLVRFDTDSLVYDLDGNLIQRLRNGLDVQRLYWDGFGQLVAVWTSGQDSTTFGYDGFGRRVRKTSGATTTHYVNDGDNLFLELESDGSVRAEYAHYPGIDRPHSVKRGGVTYYFGTDHPGSVTGLIQSSDNAVAVAYRYSPSGAGESVTGSVPNPLRFQASQLDSETGLYYKRARYYDPAVGRFISEDPVGLAGGINGYVFANNNPINATDPYGLQCYGVPQRNAHLMAVTIVCEEEWPFSTPRETGATRNLGRPNARGPSATQFGPAGLRAQQARTPQECFDENTAPVRNAATEVVTKVGTGLGAVAAAYGRYSAHLNSRLAGAGGSNLVRALYSSAPAIGSNGTVAAAEYTAAGQSILASEAGYTASAARWTMVSNVGAGLFTVFGGLASSYFAASSVLCDINPDW